MKIALVGLYSGTHLGQSFAKAADRLGIDAVLLDVSNAFRGPRILRTLSWHFADHRPLRLNRFSAEVVNACGRELPDLLISLGTASLTRSALELLRSLGVMCVAFCSDDPWNPAMKAVWHLAALPEYSVVFTPRRSNVEDFFAIGCRDVRYLPFGYDEELFGSAKPGEGDEAHDVLFVGGADRDRIAFVAEFLKSGLKTALVGSYWDRYPPTRPYALGPRNAHELRAMTAAAKVNVCLVRRANRDGHVMRSFEIAACGGCMLAEDTAEHREIFGPEGEAVGYFRTPWEAAERAAALIANSRERARMAAAVRLRAGGANQTYRARLSTILATVQELRGRNGCKILD